MEEVLDAQRSGCPPEYFNIPIPKGHSLFDPEGHGDRELPFLRTRYDMRTGNSPNAPREQVGEINLLPTYILALATGEWVKFCPIHFWFANTLNMRSTSLRLVDLRA